LKFRSSLQPANEQNQLQYHFYVAEVLQSFSAINLHPFMYLTSGKKRRFLFDWHLLIFQQL
jgi:hypothetical protein